VAEDVGAGDVPGLDDVPDFDDVTELDNVAGLEFLAPEADVPAEPTRLAARVGTVVAVLAWVGAWPLSTVDPGVSPSFTALQINPASGVTRHWVPVGQHQYPGSFGTKPGIFG